MAAVIRAPLEAGDSIPSIAKTKISVKLVIKYFHFIKQNEGFPYNFTYKL